MHCQLLETFKTL